MGKLEKKQKQENHLQMVDCPHVCWRLIMPHGTTIAAHWLNSSDISNFPRCTVRP